MVKTHLLMAMFFYYTNGKNNVGYNVSIPFITLLDNECEMLDSIQIPKTDDILVFEAALNACLIYKMYRSEAYTKQANEARAVKFIEALCQVKDFTHVTAIPCFENLLFFKNYYKDEERLEMVSVFFVCLQVFLVLIIFNSCADFQGLF